MSYWSKEKRRNAYKKIGKYKMGETKMSQITSVLKDIFEGKTKTGRTPGSPYWKLTLGSGMQITTFNEDEIRGLQVGNEYTFEYEQQGQYVNLKSKPLPCIDHQKEEAEEIRRETLPNVTSSENTERTYKNRISALQAAVTYVVATMGGTSAEKDVVETAQKFEEYIQNGK